MNSVSALCYGCLHFANSATHLHSLNGLEMTEGARLQMQVQSFGVLLGLRLLHCSSYHARRCRRLRHAP